MIVAGGGTGRLIAAVWSRSLPVAHFRTPAHYLPPPESTLSEEDVIDRKRNKSRLREKHYKRLHRLPTVQTEDEELVNSLSKQRSSYGQFGSASKVDVKKLWPSKEELALEREWECLAYPYSVQEMIAMARKAREEEEEAIQKRQEDIKRKVAKLEMWKAEVTARIQKQEREAMEAKAKKEQLIEEVRQMLGFRLDPRDERFKEALQQKEKEEKKRLKEAKKLAKEQRILERLRKEASGATSEEAGKEGNEKEKSVEGTFIA